MAAPEDDDWPNFDYYYPGSPKQLHAVGVIASCYNSFERILFDLYLHHLDRKKIPRLLSERFFLSLDEGSRVVALRDTFISFERYKKVVELINNLISYFTWAWNVRNTILHAEPYPTLILLKKDLDLVKRRKKRSAELGYIQLSLADLRYLAEKIEAGRLQAAKINVHLRYRDTKPARRSVALRLHGPEPLPKKLELPPALELSARPHAGPEPQYRRQP